MAILLRFLLPILTVCTPLMSHTSPAKSLPERTEGSILLVATSLENHPCPPKKTESKPEDSYRGIRWFAKTAIRLTIVAALAAVTHGCYNYLNHAQDEGQKLQWKSEGETLLTTAAQRFWRFWQPASNMMQKGYDTGKVFGAGIVAPAVHDFIISTNNFSYGVMRNVQQNPST